MLTTICGTLRADFGSYSLKILISRLRGSPGIVNKSWGRRCWGKMVCLWKGTDKEKATAHKPAPPYGARRWSLHAPYASQLHAFLHAGRTRRLSAPGAVSAHLFNSPIDAHSLGSVAFPSPSLGAYFDNLLSLQFGMRLRGEAFSLAHPSWRIRALLTGARGHLWKALSMISRGTLVETNPWWRE